MAFKDFSTNNFQLTAFGNAQISTSEKKYGDGSAYFDGSGDYLELPDNEAFDFGSGDFTIELWVYPTITSFQTLVAKWGNGGNAFFLGMDTNTGNIQLYLNDVAAVFGGNPTINQWYHIAAVRNGSDVKLFLNGAQVGSTYNIGNAAINSSTEKLRIADDNNSGNPAFGGYIDDLRITKGIARYTANFTPPSQQLPDPSDPYQDNVSLLLHMDNNQFVDASLNNFTITPFGDAQISTSVKKFGSGSAYFDGSGDYLKFPSSSNLILGSGDFTVEYWIYPVTWGTDDAVLGTPSSNAFSMGTDGSVNFGVANSFVAWELTGPAPNLNQWSHVAVTRLSGYMRIFVNGTIIAQGTILTNYGTPTTNLAGLEGYSWSWFNGYIDELRITKGVARYTSNFVPPTAPFVNPPRIPSDYLAFWKLNDLTDSSPNGNNLVNTNNVQFVAGKIGNCAQFDGTNYLQDNSLSPAFNPNGPSGEFTASIWINPASFSNYQAFIGGPNAGGFIIHTDAGGNLYCNEATAGDAFVGGGILQLNQWQHIVFVKSVASGNRTKIWYNGTKVYDQPTNNISNYDANITSMILGNFGSLSFPYDGRLDMVGLWNRELTQSEIDQLYDNGNGREP